MILNGVNRLWVADITFLHLAEELPSLPLSLTRLAARLSDGRWIRILEQALPSRLSTWRSLVLVWGALQCRPVNRRNPQTKRGCGALVNLSRGNGEVFHAGSSDCVAGLQRGDVMVERVTRNVLNRYLA
ncbi:hypothetical protein [Mesorhizobium sp. M0643]|uniref:hypothetical protein n=1 Tax=Mesorhizobium sp. M0643 TaxID=2956978 RepID=UPI00333D4340